MTRSTQLTARERMTVGTARLKCIGKIQYASERIANIRADQMAEDRGVMLWAYRCKLCKRWHHTSKAPRNGPAPRSG